jgi:hypothetical protein
MSSCSDTIKHYILQQEKTKENMNKLSKECPDKVLKFLLQKESTTTINKLIDCSWTDTFDKKYILKITKKTCKELN